jgi:hypothetical protein
MSFDIARELHARRLVANLAASTVLPTPQARSASRIIARSGIRGEEGLLALAEACQRGWIGRSGDDIWLTASGRCLPRIQLTPVAAADPGESLTAQSLLPGTRSAMSDGKVS